MKVKIGALLMLAVFCAGAYAVDENAAAESTREYISRAAGLAGFGGKVFCAFDILGEDVKDGIKHQYLWVVCQEYYHVNEELRKGTEVSLPMVLTLKRYVNDYRVIGHRMPRQGSYYGKDVRDIFPVEYQDNIIAAKKNGEDSVERVRRLAVEAESAARMVCHER